MKFDIKNRWTSAVQYSCKLSAEIADRSYRFQLGVAVKEAIKCGANLRDADLRGANLRNADLGDADLRRADLGGADLRGADLGGADLRGADLIDAGLRNANLRNANLGGADLGGADLSGADLSGADLGDADLRGADLSVFKQDLIAEVLRLPNELDALRTALLQGKVDGSSYSGECACLAGTLAKAHGIENYDGYDFEIGQIVFHTSATSPRERWFTMIKQGDTPDTNPASKLALEWLDEAIAIRDAIRASSASSVAPAHG